MTRVIGIGQPSAGDDGVGPFVIERLRADAPAHGELHVAREASALIELLQHPGPVFLIDAVLAPERVGSVVQLDLNQLRRAGSSVSSHGIDVSHAIELCRTLYANEFTPSLQLFAVAIAKPEGLSLELSDAVRQTALDIEDKIRGELMTLEQAAATATEANRA